MKPIIPFALLGALLAVGAANGAAVTDPVGYTTTTVYGANALGDRKISTIGPDLTLPASFSGEVDSVAGDQVTLTGAAFIAGAFAPIGAGDLGPAGPGSGSNPLLYTYYLETESGGFWGQIVSNDATSVTVELGNGANFVAGEAVHVRKHVTLLDYVGDGNANGFEEAPGGDTSTADVFTIIDEENASTNSFFYSPGIVGGAEQLVSTAFDVADAWPIYPDQGVQVSRAVVGNLSLVFSGEVDSNARQNTVKTGLNLRPIVLPVDTTLTDLNLWTGDNSTGIDGTDDLSSASADNIVILIDGVPTTVFYQTVDLGLGFSGFTSTAFADFNDVILPSGSSIQVIRNNPDNSAPFEWVVPAPVIAPPAP